MTPTTANIINLVDLYKEYFGRGSYVVTDNGQTSPAEEILYSGLRRNDKPRGTIHYSSKNISFNKQGAYGQDIWFPITLRGTNVQDLEPIEMEVEACTVSVNMVNNIVSTPVVERKGTVNEIVSLDDYKFTIRGFLIDKNRNVPEDQIQKLIALRESTQPVTLHGGYPEMFLEESCRIVINEIEFPEVQGRTHWIRPFTLTCKSDFITDLIFI